MKPVVFDSRFSVLGQIPVFPSLGVEKDRNRDDENQSHKRKVRSPNFACIIDNK